MSGNIIELKKVCKKFNHIKVLDEIDFTLKYGEIHVLVGENGSGKTLLSNIIYGIEKITSGELFYKGSLVNYKNPQQAQKQGIIMLQQQPLFYDNQDVAHNLWSGQEPLHRKFFMNIVDQKKLYEDTRAALKKMNLNISPFDRLGNLSRAEKQLLYTLRLLIHPYDIIILDEPSELLDDQSKETLYKLLLNLKSQGKSIIYITHRINEINHIGDRVTILSNGKRVDTLNVNEVNTQTILRKMFGSIKSRVYPKIIVKPGGELLRLKNICYSNILNNISFTIRKGEIVGLAGLIGSGRTMLTKAILGALKLDLGEIYINGKRVYINSPADAVKFGIGYISEDKNNLSLFDKMNFPSNFIIGKTKGERIFINNSTLLRICYSFIDKLGIKIADAHAPIRYLSEGNKQKVVLSKWLNIYSNIFIMDEATFNLDVPSREDLYNIMNELVRNGAGILFISSHISELIGMSDRILAISEGSIVKQFYSQNTSANEILNTLTDS